jgi:hypothetical protein
MEKILEYFNKQNLIIKIFVIFIIIYVVYSIITKFELFTNSDEVIKPGYLINIDNEKFTFSDGNTYIIMKAPINEFQSELKKEDYTRKSYCLKLVSKDSNNNNIFEIIDCK